MTRLLAVGDLMLGDSAASPGFGFGSRFGASGLLTPLADVAPVLSGADVVFGNLEAVISRVGVRNGRLATLHMRGFPRFANDLRHLGFTILNLANNHTMQHGRAAFDDMRELVIDAGMSCCGLRGTPPWECMPTVIRSKDGAQIGFLGYSLRPRQFHQTEEPPYAEGTPETIAADVRRLAQQVSAVLVSLHWGEEFVTVPSQEEIALAHSLVDAGACLIIGHHPHVLRPLEFHRGAVIAHSLGNFVGDQVWHQDLRLGGILECSLVGGTVCDARLVLTRLHDNLAVQLLSEGVLPPTPRSALTTAEYIAETARRLREMRRSKYRYAFRNILKGDPTLMWQAGITTLQNRLKSLGQRLRSRPAPDA